MKVGENERNEGGKGREIEEGREEEESKEEERRVKRKEKR